jgi:hypothetical protein
VDSNAAQLAADQLTLTGVEPRAAFKIEVL